MLVTDTGTPLYRPVIVTNPLSEDRTNSLGDASNKAVTELAREDDPTVNFGRIYQNPQPMDQ